MNQSGGFQQNFTELLEKYGSPFEILLFIVLFLGIVFMSKLPPALAKHSDTTLGRLFWAAATYFVVNRYGWSIGLVFALFAGLLIGAGSSKSIKEGFNADLRVIPSNDKWFIERVLGENPKLIEEENVKTQAIQDDSGKTTGSVENTSVST
jgi:hypothetical protein